MKVIAIHEENHGFIGVATTQRAAWRFIIEADWFSAYEEVWVLGEWVNRPIAKLMNKPEEEISDDELIDWLMENAGTKYETCFSFEETELWDGE